MGVVAWAALVAAAMAVGAEAESDLLIVERGVKSLRVKLLQESRHGPDVDPGDCKEGVVLDDGMHLGHRDAEHHFNLVYTVKGVTCRLKMYGDRDDHQGTRSEWNEEVGAWYLPSGFGETKQTGIFIKESNTYTAHIPKDATDVKAEAADGTFISSIDVAQHRLARGAKTLSGEGIVHDTQQATGDVTNTQNIVFISGGYTEYDQFSTDVDKTMDLIRMGKATFPLARYLSAMNVFSVFQPSVGAGASKPQMNIFVDNNLGCTYGSGGNEPARALRCDRNLAQALADTSPAKAKLQNTLVMVIVNDVDYGGTGLHSVAIKMATFYSGALSDSQRDLARSLVYHEIGHALVDLQDEYTTSEETTEATDCSPPYYNQSAKCSKNCAVSLSNIGWQSWIDAGGVPADPSPGCYYKNLYKPGRHGPEPCLMEKVSSTELCPVCREASTLQLYQNGLVLTNPSCPHPDWAVVYLARTGRNSTQAEFYANNRLFGLSNIDGANSFRVWWAVDGVAQPRQNGTSFLVAASRLSAGSHTVQLHVDDVTPAVLGQHRLDNMYATAEWRIEVRETLAEIEAVQGLRSIDCAFFDSANPPRQYLATCNGPNDTCTFAYSSSPYENPKNLDDTVAAIERWIFGLGGAFVGGGIILFLFIYFCIVTFSDEARRVMEDSYTKPIKYTRRILIVSNLIFVMASIASMVFLAVLYTKVGALVKLGLLAGMGLAGALFLIGVVGLTSAVSKKVPPLIFSGILLILILLTIFVVVVVLYYFGYNCDNEGSKVQSTLQDEWESQVKSDPDLVCTIQKEFSCTGWLSNCFNDAIGAGDGCPEECEETNVRYSATCKVEVSTFLHKWLPAVASFLLLLVYLLLCGAILCFLLVHILRRSNNLDKHKSKLLQDGPIEGLLSVARLHHGDKKQFRQSIEREFKRYDKSGTGALDKLEFSLLFKSTIGVELSEEQLDLLFALIDVTGTGQIRLTEWLDVLWKTTSLSVEETIDFLSERKEMAAMIEDRRRMERLEMIDGDPSSPIGLDDENEDSYDQAYQLYGRLDDEEFFNTRDEFLKLADQENGTGDAVVSTEAYSAHLQTMFKLNLKSRAAQTVINELPKLIDKDGTGKLTWTDWMATYFVRRDCYMEILKMKRRGRARRADQIRRDADKSGISLRRGSTMKAPADVPPTAPTVETGSVPSQNLIPPPARSGTEPFGSGMA